MPSPNMTMLSFSIKKDKAEQLAKELPRYGDRSRLLQWFVDRFLEGKIDFAGVKRASKSQAVS